MEFFKIFLNSNMEVLVNGKVIDLTKPNDLLPSNIKFIKDSTSLSNSSSRTYDDIVKTSTGKTKSTSKSTSSSEIPAKKYALIDYAQRYIGDAKVPDAFSNEKYQGVDVPDYIKEAQSYLGARGSAGDQVKMAEELAELVKQPGVDPAIKNRILKELNGLNYYRTGRVSELWCGLFPALIFARMGMFDKIPAGFASARSWQNVGSQVSLDNAPVGSIVTMRSKHRVGGGHVGMLIGRDPTDRNKIYVLGGNQGGGVRVEEFYLDGTGAHNNFTFHWPNGVDKPTTASVPDYDFMQMMNDNYSNALYTSKIEKKSLAA